MSKHGLGKGLDALITPSDASENVPAELDIDCIIPNHEQPRSDFDEEELSKLSSSIEQHGVIQPIVVRKVPPNNYQIVAGERRWRAAKSLGLRKIPVVLKELSDVGAMEVAVTENIQRVDLNPIDEASAYLRLMRQYDMNQESLAARVGKNRSTIANTLRLLNLPERVKTYLKSGELSSGHGRALAAIENNPALQEHIAERIVKKEMSVRETESLVKQYIQSKTSSKRVIAKDEHITYLEGTLRTALGTKVELLPGKKHGQGRISIEFYSDEELERLLELLCAVPKL